jgi:hypothetical protein
MEKIFEKFKPNNDLNIQVKILDEIEDYLKILKEKNVKNIDNIINKKTIRKGEKSNSDNNEHNQAVICKNAITFLEKKQQKIVQEYLSKFAGNDNLYIHQNIYEGNNPSFLLLNLPEDQEGFMKFWGGDYLDKKRLG